jgi:hypothetical protein
MTDEQKMRTYMLLLVTIQTSLKTLETLMSNKDDLANKLSDIWNTLLDCRDNVINNLITNKHMQIAGLPDAFSRELARSK